MHSWSLLAYRFTLAYIQHTFVIAWKLYINRVVFGAMKTENVDVRGLTKKHTKQFSKINLCQIILYPFIIPKTNFSRPVSLFVIVTLWNPHRSWRTTYWGKGSLETKGPLPQKQFKIDIKTMKENIYAQCSELMVFLCLLSNNSFPQENPTKTPLSTRKMFKSNIWFQR